jgi:hypothetical protein
MSALNPSTLEVDSLLERRNYPRRRGGDIKIRVTDYGAKEQPIEGFILDRSPGGLCMWLPRPVPAGTILSVRTSTAPDVVPWVHVEVIYCHRHDGYYVAGCQFTHVVPWSVRVLFG